MIHIWYLNYQYNSCSENYVSPSWCSCLDKAVIMAEPYSTDPVPATTWLSCTVTQVEEVKILLRMVPIWLTCILYSASMCQTTTTFLQQGVLMNSMVGSLSIPAASLSSIEVVFMMIFVVIQDKIIIPICRRHFQNPSGLTQLQRMGIGRFLIIFSMVAAACLEAWRLSCYKDKKSLSILWQVPQYLILAWSDVFCGIAQLEFFYGEAPQSMTSLCSAFSFLAISLGYYLNSFLVTFVASVTKVDGGGGWLPTDLNMGHLDYYFLLWAGISVLNFVVYVALSRKYTHKKAAFQ